MSLSLATRGVICPVGRGVSLATRGVICYPPVARAKFFDGFLLNRDNFVGFSSHATGVACLQQTMATCDARAATLGAGENVTKTEQQGGTARLLKKRGKTPYGL